MKSAHLKFFERLVDYWDNDFFYRCRYYFSSDCIAQATRNHKNIDVRAAAITLFQWITEEWRTQEPFEEIEIIPLSERVLELRNAYCHQVVRSWVSNCEDLKEILHVKDGNIYWSAGISEAATREIIDYIASSIRLEVQDARNERFGEPLTHRGSKRERN